MMRTRNSSHAFTLIEILVVMAVIAILVSFATLSFLSVRKDAQDSTARGNITVLGEALEKYYEKNGEYPAVPALVNTQPGNTGDAIADKLGIPVSALQLPNTPKDVTNPIVSSTPTTGYIAYIAQPTTSSSSCQSAANGGCDSFVLRYTEESGTLVSIESRHNSRIASDPAPEAPTSVSAPGLTAKLAAPTITATAKYTELCGTALTYRYAFSYRTKLGSDSNFGSWSEYSPYSGSDTYSFDGVEGATYEIKATVRCDREVGGIIGETSTESGVVSILYPITAPDAPTVAIGQDGENVVATSSPVTCAANTTAQYSFRRSVNESPYGEWTAWDAQLTNSQSSDQGAQYIYKARARCHMAYVDSLAAESAEATYVRPITTVPNVPTVTVADATTAVAWNWNATTACPSGTYAQYQGMTKADYETPLESAWGPYTAYTSRTLTSQEEGYEFIVQVQTRCASPYTAGTWSGAGSKNYIRSITAPGAATDFTFETMPGRKVYWFYWKAPTCKAGAGVQEHVRVDAYVEPGSGMVWPGTGKAGWYGWIGPGAYSGSLSVTSVNNVAFPVGGKVQSKAQYLCVNPITGRTSAYGPEALSPIFQIY